MPIFSKISNDRLATCHQDLQTLFNEVIKYFDCSVSEGFRNQADQDADFAKGTTTLKWPNGNHNKNPSMAVDVYPYPVNLSPANAKEAEFYKMRMCFFAGQVKAIARVLQVQGKITHSVVWGCDWNDNTVLDDQSFYDFPHFELKS